MDTNEILAKFDEKLKECTKGLVNEPEYKAAIEELKLEIKAANEISVKEDRIKVLEEAMVKQGLLIEEMKAPRATDAETKSVNEQVSDIIKENNEGFKDFTNKVKPFKFNLKVAGTMTYSNITNATTLLPMPAMIPGYNPYAWNPATFWTYSNVQSTQSARIAYVDEINPDGTPATTTEGNTKPAIDFDNKVSYSSAIKVAAHIKVSDEMLDDVSFLGGQVNDNLVNRVRLAVSGNIYTYITTFSGIYTAVDSSLTNLAGAEANIWQLVVAAKATLAKGNKNMTHLFLNPTDYARLEMLKGDAQRPVIVSATSSMVNGVLVISTNAVTVDKYLAYDVSKLNVYEYKALSVEMGWDGEDFTKNLRTFVGETRVHYFIKDNDATAFLYGDITDDLTALTA